MIQSQNISQQRKMLLESFKMNIDQSDISSLQQYNQLIQSNFKDESPSTQIKKKQNLTLSNEQQSINTELSSIFNSPQHQAIMNTFSKTEKMKSPQKKEFLSPQMTNNTQKYENLIKKTFQNGQSSPIKVLFTMTIDMGHNNHRQIDINSHEEPITIARRFCAQNNLTQEAVTILAQNIQANKQQYLYEKKNLNINNDNDHLVTEYKRDQKEIKEQKEQTFIIPASVTKNKKVNQQQQKQIQEFIKKIQKKDEIPNNVNQNNVNNQNLIQNNIDQNYNQLNNNLITDNSQSQKLKQIIQNSSPKNILNRVVNKHMKGRSTNQMTSNNHFNNALSDVNNKNVNEDLIQLSQIKQQIDQNLSNQIQENIENNDKLKNVQKIQENIQSTSEIQQLKHKSYDKKLNMYFNKKNKDDSEPVQMFSPKINITKSDISNQHNLLVLIFFLQNNNQIIYKQIVQTTIQIFNHIISFLVDSVGERSLYPYLVIVEVLTFLTW